MLPQKTTQPNSVSIATGAPVGLVRRLWQRTSTKISTPNKRSLCWGSPNPGSARGNPERWVQERSKGTGVTGKSHVTFGSTTAVKSIFRPFEWVDKIWKLAINRSVEPTNDLAMPDTQTLHWERGSLRLWTRHSDTNEEVDPLSSRALASIVNPSGAKTSTRQVIRSELELTFMAALETVWVGEGPLGRGGWGETDVQ